MIQPFRASHAQADHWGLAAKACLDAIGGVSVPDDNIGFVYVTRTFAAELTSIVNFLREATGLRNWLGAVGFGVFATGSEIHEGGAVALMVGALPPESLQLVEFEDAAGFTAAHAAWLDEHPGSVAIVHGDARRQTTPALIADLAEAGGGFLIGGLTAAAEPQERIAGRLTDAGLSGVLLGDPVRVAVGLTQGCSPIGAAHSVTEAMGEVVLAIDGQPALEVLRAEAGELIARDLRRAAGYIHVGLPVRGSDTGDYVVRSLTGIDPQHGWLAVDAELSPGDRLMFVRRDANAAQKDMRRMLDGLHGRVVAAGGRPLGALYVSCVARGPHMFGDEGQELAMIEARFGDLPLIGFSANGEICGDRLYTYTGVLAVFIEDGE